MRTAFAVTMCMLMLTVPAHAQDFNFDANQESVRNQSLNANIIHVGGLIREQAQKGDQRESLPQNPILLFDATTERRVENFDNLMRQNFGRDPARAETMAQALGNGKILVDVGDLIEARGLNRHNIADVYAWWSIEAWKHANGVNGETSDITLRAVQKQMADMMVASPEIAQLDDATKQRFTEQLMFQAVLMSLRKNELQGQAGSNAEYRQWIEGHAKNMGFALSAMTLTDKGFVPK